jgi:hypothetical protein
MSRLTRPRGERRSRSGWFGPLLLILIGAAFWLNNAGVFEITRQVGGWLVLIPAVLLLATALPAALAGRWRGAVLRGLAGLVLAGVSAMLIFGWELGSYWPGLLVIAGLLLLVPFLLGKEQA